MAFVSWDVVVQLSKKVLFLGSTAINVLVQQFQNITEHNLSNTEDEPADVCDHFDFH